MANLVMELTERNLAKHDERLAEIREKRMIDPNSEKFYRIWSWIRDVNEQQAGNGNLTTPQQSRPSTARGSHHVSVAVAGPQQGAPMMDDVEEIILANNNNNVQRKSATNGGNVPLALLNVVTAPNQEPDVMFIDEDDLRAVDDDDYEPPNAPRNSTISHGKQQTWAALAGNVTSRQLNQVQERLLLTRQQNQQHYQQQQQHHQGATTFRAPANPTLTSSSNFQNYPYGPTPSGKFILSKSTGNVAAERASPAPAQMATNSSNRIQHQPQQQQSYQQQQQQQQVNAASRKVEGAFLSIGNASNTSQNAGYNAMAPGNYYTTSVSRSGQVAGSQPMVMPSGSYVRNHTIATAVVNQAAGQAERLRSAVSRRTAPAVISVSSQQQALHASQPVFLKLQVSGEQLKPKMAMESRSQASLVSTDPSATSKLSLPLMDRIRRITSKVKPLKSAFSSNAASSRNISMDSLANFEASTHTIDAIAADMRASPRVRFVGVPSMDDDDDDDDSPPRQPPPTTSKLDNNSSSSTNKKQNGAKRFLQQTAQRFYRPFVSRNHQPGRSQEAAPAPLQVTLV